MITLTFRPALFTRRRNEAPTRRRTVPNAAGESSDAARDRRAFVQEMIGRNPDAFASEMDVQCMLHLYPGRF